MKNECTCYTDVKSMEMNVDAADLNSSHYKSAMESGHARCPIHKDGAIGPKPTKRSISALDYECRVAWQRAGGQEANRFRR